MIVTIVCKPIIRTLKRYLFHLTNSISHFVALNSPSRLPNISCTGIILHLNRLEAYHSFADLIDASSAKGNSKPNTKFGYMLSLTEILFQQAHRKTIKNRSMDVWNFPHQREIPYIKKEVPLCRRPAFKTYRCCIERNQADLV
jgi:hypothetical protein